jgi:predicted RNase H-like HicB family nuclease
MKTLEEYMATVYPITIYPPIDDSGYFVEIEDLDGCWADGDTLEEAMEKIQQSKKVWIECCLEQGWNIPEPSDFRVENAPMRFMIPIEQKLAAKICEQSGNPEDFIIQVLKEKLENLS